MQQFLSSLVSDKSNNPAAKKSFFSAAIQPKLSINQPNDIYEQEADVMADKIMRMPDASLNNNLFFKPAITPVQRKCAHCEEEEKKMQRKEINGNEAMANASTENYINSLNGKGTSLTQNEKSFFEPKFGHDFSNVQLHTNSEANQSAKNINALAYTHGNHIVFGSNQYKPNTESGKRLMAHELTHVVQQNNSQQNIQRACDAAKTSESKQAKIQPFVVANDDGTAPVATPDMIGVDEVWEKCCVHMNVQPVKTIKKSSAKTLEVGGGTASAAETDLASNRDGNCINVIMVDSFKNGGTVSKNHSGGGRTFYLGTTSPVSILVEGAIPTVVAHEIGHALRGNTDHEAGTIMEGSGAYNAPNPDKVSSTVCSTVRTWSELKNIAADKVDCCLTY